MKISTYQPQSIILPKEVPVHRTFPFKGPNQVDWIDDTVFYDIFYKHDNSTIICIGPPLLNLGVALELQEISCNGKRLSYKSRRLCYTRGNFSQCYNLIVIRVPRFLKRELTIQLSFRFNLFEKAVEIVCNHPPTQENGKSLLTLVTMQKDNPLRLIRDWIRWHKRLHGVGQLILYDNGSKDYGYDELADALYEEDLQSVLVNWDFPYTWDGHAWNCQDSRKVLWAPWPQMGALNHSYLKFGRCGWLLNLDIDEYLVSEDGTSLQDYTRQTPRHYLGFAQRRVQGIGPEKPLAERSFRDFLWRDNPRSNSTTPKYACQCNMPLWLDIHWIIYRRSLLRYKRSLRLKFQATQTKLGSIVKRMWQKIFKYSNILEKPRATINSPREKFWVYHFNLLGTEWRPSRENRVLYRDKAYFEAKGLEITYDNVMIKQAEKHSL